MNNKYLFKIILMILFILHSSLLFAVDKIIIEKCHKIFRIFLKVLMLARFG